MGEEYHVSRKFTKLERSIIDSLSFTYTANVRFKLKIFKIENELIKRLKTILTDKKLRETTNCPRRDFAQKAKSRGGTLVTHAYIKESTYS